MFRASLFLLICTIASSADGMDCTFGRSRDPLIKYFNSCPDDPWQPSKSYCCINFSEHSIYCCDAREYAKNTGLVTIVSAVCIVVLILCCTGCCCCCCSFCPWYRSRQPGIVYSIPLTTPQATYNAGENQTTMFNHGREAPPRNTAEAYVKQAPYNPTYGE